MFPLSHLWLAALIGVGVSISPSFAGWVCIKNETKMPIVVQELPERPTLRRGKLVKLLPGEVYREYHRTAGTRKVRIFDASSPSKPLCHGKLTWQSADVILKVEIVDKVVHLVPATLSKKTAPAVVQVGNSQPKR